MKEKKNSLLNCGGKHHLRIFMSTLRFLDADENLVRMVVNNNRFSSTQRLWIAFKKIEVFVWNFKGWNCEFPEGAGTSGL